MTPKPVGGNHTIHALVDNDGLVIEFACHEDNHGPCRWTCGLDCETWGDECLNNHPRQRIEYCNPLEFITNDDSEWYEKYVGEPNVEFRSGPIDLIWIPSVDTYGWRYADE